MRPRTVIDGDGRAVYEVLSGNHRVKASIAAGLTEIDICLTGQAEFNTDTPYQSK